MRCDRVFRDYFTRGRDGVCQVKACDFYSEGVLSDLSACSETHLQLPLKLNIVGKKLCEVWCIVLCCL